MWRVPPPMSSHLRRPRRIRVATRRHEPYVTPRCRRIGQAEGFLCCADIRLGRVVFGEASAFDCVDVSGCMIGAPSRCGRCDRQHNEGCWK